MLLKHGTILNDGTKALICHTRTLFLPLSPKDVCHKVKKTPALRSVWNQELKCFLQ